MKKFLTTLSFFLFCCIVFYVLSVFVWGGFLTSTFKPNINYPLGAYGHMHSRILEVKKTANIDLLFLGSSHAYRGFDTRIFSHHGLKTFNLGSSAQTPIQSDLLLNRYLDKLNPKTVVYEVYPETFMADGVESSLDVIANDKNDFQSLKMTAEIRNIITFNTFIYACIRDVLNLNESYIEPIVKGSDTYVSGGFVEKKMRYFKPAPLAKKNIRINKNQLRHFSKIVEKLKRKKINLVLVYAPIPRSSYERYSNNAQFDSIMQTFGNYYNFNKLLSLDETFHFYDSNHLNQNGVATFNKNLIEFLLDEKKKLGLFAWSSEASN